MKATFASTLLFLGTLAAAQSIADLPSCSLQCVATGVTGLGCGLTDFACSCKKADQLTPVVTPCVQAACPSAADQAKVISTLQGICAAAGFPITIPQPPAASSAAPTSSEAPASSQPPQSQKSETPASSKAPEKSDAPASSYAPTIQTSVPATPLPTDSCVIKTVTVTVSSGKPKPTTAAPYPTGPVGTGVPAVPSHPTSSYPPMFTGAASAMKVPAGVAGVLGLAAYFL